MFGEEEKILINYNDTKHIFKKEFPAKVWHAGTVDRHPVIFINSAMIFISIAIALQIRLTILALYKFQYMYVCKTVCKWYWNFQQLKDYGTNDMFKTYYKII